VSTGNDLGILIFCELLLSCRYRRLLSKCRVAVVVQNPRDRGAANSLTQMDVFLLSLTLTMNLNSRFLETAYRVVFRSFISL